MKLNQNFFWDKFLLIWGIIGMLFPVVVVMRFEVKGLFELLLLGGMAVFLLFKYDSINAGSS